MRKVSLRRRIMRVGIRGQHAGRERPLKGPRPRWEVCTRGAARSCCALGPPLGAPARACVSYAWCVPARDGGVVTLEVPEGWVGCRADPPAPPQGNPGTLPDTPDSRTRPPHQTRDARGADATSHSGTTRPRLAQEVVEVRKDSGVALPLSPPPPDFCARSSPSPSTASSVPPPTDRCCGDGGDGGRGGGGGDCVWRIAILAGRGFLRFGRLTAARVVCQCGRQRACCAVWSEGRLPLAFSLSLSAAPVA